jgi:hypothetical protein
MILHIHVYVRHDCVRCVIFVMKNLTQTERSHRCALFRPRTLS